MHYAWESIDEEHNALLRANEPKERPLSNLLVLAARREDGSLAGWATLKQPGPMLVLASTSPLVAIHLIDRIDQTAHGLGVGAYAVSTRSRNLRDQMKRLPGFSYNGKHSVYYWFLRRLAA